MTFISNNYKILTVSFKKKTIIKNYLDLYNANTLGTKQIKKYWFIINVFWTDINNNNFKKFLIQWVNMWCNIKIFWMYTLVLL